MKLISLNTGLPREIDVNGHIVRTSIWKSPRHGRLHVTAINIEGDEQSDLTVHGGEFKAVYCYPSEHYEFWRRELPHAELPWGAFGENFTTEGLIETDVRIGDRFQIGSAEFQVTQPRQPCFKLGLRFGREDMINRFLGATRPGFYVRVAREGDVAQDDPVHFVERATGSISVSDIFTLHFDEGGQPEQLRRAAAAPGLAPGWRNHFLKRLSSIA